MRTFIRYLITIIGILSMLYFAIYVMLYGGIMQIINNTSGKDIAIGILKIIFCEAGLIPGYVLIELSLLIPERRDE